MSQNSSQVNGLPDQKFTAGDGVPNQKLIFRGLHSRFGGTQEETKSGSYFAFFFSFFSLRFSFRLFVGSFFLSFFVTRPFVMVVVL